MIQNCWTLPCVIALRAWSGAGTKAHAWPTFALLTTLLAYPYCHAIVTYGSFSYFLKSLILTKCASGWVSRNSGSVRTRSVSAALYNSKTIRYLALTMLIKFPSQSRSNSGILYLPTFTGLTTHHCIIVGTQFSLVSTCLCCSSLYLPSSTMCGVTRDVRRNGMR